MVIYIEKIQRPSVPITYRPLRYDWLIDSESHLYWVFNVKKSFLNHQTTYFTTGYNNRYVLEYIACESKQVGKLNSLFSACAKSTTS